MITSDTGPREDAVSQIRFETRDAAEIRFGVSPLWETVRSLYVLADPGRHVIHLPWARRAAELARDPQIAQQVELLRGFARPGAWLPDFLTPPPSGVLDELADELAVVAATPAETVATDIAATARRSPVSRPAAAIARDPATMLPALVAAVDAWHRVAIAPHWSRMRGLLEADIAHRARQLAEGGVRRLFDTLHPTVRWAGDRIIADDPWDLDLDLRGRGLPLMPSVFVDRRVLWTVRTGSAPVAVYPARAAATLWESRPATDTALAAVVGANRARLLQLAAQPVTTTELARRTGLSAPAVSQHLRTLYDAGLLTRSQHGRSVLYVTTRLGSALLRATPETEP